MRELARTTATSRQPRPLRLALLDDLCRKAAEPMIEAYRSQEQWVEAVRAALLALLCFLEARPNAARFMLVSSLAGDASVRARRAQALATLARALDADCPAHAPALACSPFGGQAVVGAVAAILHARLSERPPQPLTELCDTLMAMIVLPYLGPTAACRELQRTQRAELA